MNEEHGVIVVTCENVVYSIRTVTRDNASSRMMDACQESCSNWDDYDPDAVTEICESGVFETGKSRIELIWLDEDGDYNS